MNFDKYEKDNTITDSYKNGSIEKIEIIEGTAHIYLAGRIHINSYESIQKEIKDLIYDNNVSNICLNLRKVDYVSSAGLRMFSALYKISSDCSKGYKLIELRKDIGKMFEMTGYSSIFPIELQE